MGYIAVWRHRDEQLRNIARVPRQTHQLVSHQALVLLRLVVYHEIDDAEAHLFLFLKKGPLKNIAPTTAQRMAGPDGTAQLTSA